MDANTTARSGRDAALAHLLLRAALGLNLLMHGVARLLNGPDKFTAGLVQMFASTPLPQPLVAGFASALPWVEGTLGLLILIGLGTRAALAAAGVLMLVLTFGVTLRQDWATASIQLTYAAVIAALVATLAWDRYSADALLKRKASAGRR